MVIIVLIQAKVFKLPCASGQMSWPVYIHVVYIISYLDDINIETRTELCWTTVSLTSCNFISKFSSCSRYRCKYQPCTILKITAYRAGNHREWVLSVNAYISFKGNYNFTVKYHANLSFFGLWPSLPVASRTRHHISRSLGTLISGVRAVLLYKY